MNDKFKKFLIEAPLLNDEERLAFMKLFKISDKALKKHYTILAPLKDNYYLVQKNETGQYFVIETQNENVYATVKIDARNQPFPVTPAQLSDYIQISMVRVAEGYQKEGTTKKAYIEIAKLHDLISDNEQYQASKALWQSLARTSEVNVYVYDGRLKDYIRDGKDIVKYNGENIDEAEIWKNHNDFKKVLLVATIKELK